MNTKKAFHQQNLRIDVWLFFSLLTLALTACGGGGGGGGSGGGSGGGGGNGGSNSVTFQVEMTEIEFEDNRNGRVFSTTGLSSGGATITKN